MKLSCLPVSYFNEIIKGRKTVLDWADEARKIGYDCIDLSVLFFQSLKRSYLEDLKKDLDTIGVDIAIINTYTDFTNPNGHKRKAELEKFKEYIAAAEILGSSYVRVTAGQAHPEVLHEEGISWAAEGITGALESSWESPVKLLFENHAKPGIWDYTDFTFDVDIFLKIYEKIKDTPIRILFDTANPVASGTDPLKLIDKVYPSISAIHAADTKKEGIFSPVLIGTGAVPLREIFIKLKTLGFDGLVSIEEASLTGRRGIEKAYKYIKDLIEE